MCPRRIFAASLSDELQESRQVPIQEIERSTPAAAGSRCPLCHDPQPLLSINHAAALAGVTRKTIYRWMRAGILRCVVLPSGSTRIFRESLVRIPRRSRRPRIGSSEPPG
jgi:hypothetical protein